MLTAHRPDYNDTVSGMVTKLNYLAKELAEIQFPNEKRIYTELDCIRLSAAIEKLNQVAAKAPNKPESIKDAKQILIQTWLTITEPTQNNYRQLQQVADRVQGHGNAGLRLVSVVLTIIGFLAGILPGLIMLCCTVDMYDKNKRKGLARATDDMLDSIAATTAPRRMGSNRFFEPSVATEMSAPGFPYENASAPPPDGYNDPNATFKAAGMN